MGEKRKKTYFDAVPGVGNCEGSVFLQYVEDDSRDRLCLLRRRFQLDRLHLGLRLLRHHPDCCPKHVRRPGFLEFKQSLNQLTDCSFFLSQKSSSTPEVSSINRSSQLSTEPQRELIAISFLGKNCNTTPVVLKK